MCTCVWGGREWGRQGRKRLKFCDLGYSVDGLGYTRALLRRHTYEYASIYLSTYVYISYICIYIYIYTHIHIYIHTHTQIVIHTMYVCIYIYTHTHIHIRHTSALLRRRVGMPRRTRSSSPPYEHMSACAWKTKKISACGSGNQRLLRQHIYIYIYSVCLDKIYRSL